MKTGLPAVLALCFLAACRPHSLSPTLVQVNDESITAADVDLEKRLSGPIAGRDEDLLEGLIDQTLILQEGRRLGVTLTQDALRAAESLARGGSEQAAFEASLKERGSSLKEWRERLALAALADEVIRQAVRNKVEISRQEIQDYYWEHLPSFRLGKLRILRQIFSTERKNADAAHKELQLGASFVEVAKARGEGPEAVDGGLLPGESRHQLSKALMTEAGKLKVGQFSGVLKSPWGWHILYLERVEKEAGQTLEQASSEVHARLLREKEQVLYRLWLAGLRQAAVIERHGDTATQPKAKVKP